MMKKALTGLAALAAATLALTSCAGGDSGGDGDAPGGNVPLNIGDFLDVTSWDPALADIGFAGGWLDSAALLAFVGAGSGYVVTWYDQSGAGRDVASATAAAQPRLVNAGTLEAAANGRPWALFSGAQSLASASLADLPAGNADSALMAVGKADNAATTRIAVMYGGTNNGQQRVLAAAVTTAEGRASIGGAGVNTGLATQMSSGVGNFGSETVELSWNGAAAAGSFGTLATVTPSPLVVGSAPNNTLHWFGGLAEAAIFSRKLTVAEIAVLRADHRNVWGTA